MAARSGAGTGVIVSLVVFIILSVALLVLTIVFYRGQVEAVEARAQAESDLQKYVRPADRASDVIKTIEGEAGRTPVAIHLNRKLEDLMALAHGTRSTSLPELEAAVEIYGVDEETSMLAAMDELSRGIRAAEQEQESLERRLRDRDDDVAELEARIQQMQASHREQIDAVEGQIQGYRDSAERYAQDVVDTKEQMQRAIAELTEDYEDEIRALEGDIDEIGQTNVVLKSRLEELERVINERRIKGRLPALLVDGRVIDAADADDRVFIDRGRQDRIVLGMTFEVYDDEASLRVDRNGQVPRGKASLQVIKVGETTSTCKITRAVPGRPVVRDDVVANAVYDPEYRFSFLVHGVYDVDNDGRATEAEAEWIRAQIRKWGGTVVSSDTLPGDLDFLVLGAEPPRPAPLSPGADQFALQEYLRRNRVWEKYDDLKQSAMEAQIPILNANRFFILIGYTER